MNNIGQRIRELRKKNDLTQEALADFLGITYKAVSKWECGMTVPDISLIMPLSRILHVTADELLGGNTEEADLRRAELDERCENNWKYDQQEMYELALQAVKEYPGDYKYLTWLANMEYYMAYEDPYREDPAKPYSSEMIERSIKHSNMVIEGCTDYRLREKAMWNAMICCRYSDQQDKALAYAKMFPERKPITRARAMEVCLEGEELIVQRQAISYEALHEFCMSLMELYRFANRKEPHVMAALDTEEAVLKTVFSDENYLDFHWHLYCAFVNVQGLAELELISHDVTLIGLIKQIRLKCIVCTDKEKALIADHAFTDEKDQKRCRKLMRLALILMFPISLLLMPVGIYWLFNDEVVFVVMAFLFSIPWGIDLVYFLKMRKWKIAQKAEYE